MSSTVELVPTLISPGKLNIGSREALRLRTRTGTKSRARIIAKRLRQPRFHANFGRIFKRPKFRPYFHA